MPLLTWRQQPLPERPGNRRQPVRMLPGVRRGGGPAPRGWSCATWVGLLVVGRQSQPALLVLAGPCGVCPDPTSAPSLLGRGWRLRLGGGTLGTALGIHSWGMIHICGAYLLRVLRLGASFRGPGVLHPRNYSHRASSRAAISASEPSPLPHWPEHMWREGRERMTTRSQGYLPQKGKEKKGFFVCYFLFHKPSS